MGELRDGKLHWNGRTLDYKATGSPPPNGPIWWSISPTNLHFTTPDAPNTLPAQLLSCVRLGTSWHLELTIGDHKLQAITETPHPIGPLNLSLPPEAIQLIPDRKQS